MNLIYLHGRRSPDLSCPEGTVAGKLDWNGTLWRGLEFPNVPGVAIRLRNYVDSHPVWSRPDTVGWFAASKGGRAELEIALEVDGTVVAGHRAALSPSPSPVLLPWPDAGVALGPEATLVLRCAGGGGADRIVVLVHRVLSRQHLYDLAKGTGVEVGPGPKPQIHPSQDTEVVYVEEMPPEKWAALYDTRGRYGSASADWSAIRIGKAGDLPVADASRDFIFSSHVFEHLANPLGHLAHWHAKLRPGGVVLAVVPDLGSTNDRFMRPSTLEEILAEHAEGIFEPQPRHFERFAARATGGRVPEPRLARTLMEEGQSIHVHFYDREGMARLLAAAVEGLGYRGFRIVHTDNHKDFHFCLRK